jgi:putative Mg2+ transporter-C (MgtC) family protein
VALAGVLGGVIGLEREWAKKPAGLRTHILVAAASALMMVLGETIVRSFQQEQQDHVVSADPIRIIHAVAIGVSFLGAGTILHQGGNRVEGLTTAGSILFTSGIGLAVAMHQFVLAVGLTVLALVVLLIIGRAEMLFGGDHDSVSHKSAKRGKAPPTGD